MNKKGNDKMLSMYWFFILFLVAVAIVYMVSLFYSHPYDVRDVEAEILVNKVSDCVSYGGELNNDLISEGNFSDEFKNNFLEKCSLDFESEKVFEGEIQYYSKVGFYLVGDLENPVYEILAGNLNLASDCELNGEEFEKLSKCVKKRFYSVSGGEQYLVEVVGVVRKGEKNVT